MEEVVITAVVLLPIQSRHHNMDIIMPLQRVGLLLTIAAIIIHSITIIIIHMLDHLHLIILPAGLGIFNTIDGRLQEVVLLVQHTIHNNTSTTVSINHTT